MLYNGMLMLVIVVALAGGVAVGYVFKQRLSRKKLESSENLSARIIDEAKKEAETIKKKFVEAAKSMKLGYGLDESVTHGPMTTPDGKNKVVNWIERSIQDGAKVVLDGRLANVPEYPKGYWLGPTILEGVDPEMPTAKEEAFGPVASLIRGVSLEKTIEWINTTTNLGHSGCIFTASGKAQGQKNCEDNQDEASQPKGKEDQAGCHIHSIDKLRRIE